MLSERHFEISRSMPLRRLTGSMVVLTLLAQLLVPCRAGASPQRAKAACCERNGKHHCDRTVARSSSANQYTPAGPSIRAIANKCPFRNLIASHSVGQFALVHSHTLALEASDDGRVAEASLGFATLDCSSHTDRGPPLPQE
jgi:hypothetical protein